PQIPDRDGLVQSVKTALEHFDKCFDNQIKDVNFYRHVKEIMEQGRKFRSMTQDSVGYCEVMAAHATDFMEYTQILMEDDVSGGDFIGVMKSHIQSATFNKSSAARLTKGYCDMLATLKNIVNELEDYIVRSNVERKPEKKIEKEVPEIQEPQASPWVTVGNSILTGVNLAASNINDLINAVGTSVVGDRYENELQRINQIIEDVNIVMTELVILIDKFSCFDEFFKLESEDITKVVEKYSADANNATFRMTRMKGTAMKKQWCKIHQVFDDYVNSIKPLLEAKTGQTIDDVPVRGRNRSISSLF
ncbi:3048_t:CDS:2, partial [Acaulospora colombiana]